MPRSWPVRLQALLLALLVLGGGGRLPVVDGAVFHRQAGAAAQSVVLAEDAVAPHGAADHLASGIPASGPASGAEGRIEAALAVASREQISPPAAPRTHRPDPLSLPRAPPARA